MGLRFPGPQGRSRRFPRGKRGLKSIRCEIPAFPIQSLPSREAWIEMVRKYMNRPTELRRFPRGKRGLKFYIHALRYFRISRFPRGKRGLKWVIVICIKIQTFCRFPRGKRGLKSRNVPIHEKCHASLPSREAWIEIWTAPGSSRWTKRRFPRGKRGLKSKQ